MDEEGKKIDLGNFFNRVDEVDKKASTALSKSNMSLSAVNANKLLIETLSMTIETMKTDIRDIANYIIIERELEKDLKEDRILEEQDKQQKEQMESRLKEKISPNDLKPQKGEKGEKGDPGSGGGGGFMAGLLGLVGGLGLAGGLTALATAIGPFILPIIGGALLFKFKDQIGTFLKDRFTDLKEGISNTVEEVKGGIGGVADFLTGDLFDFDGEGKGDSPLAGVANRVSDTVGDIKERGLGGVLGGVGDFLTGGIFDFDRKGDTEAQENFQGGVEDVKENIGDAIGGLRDRGEGILDTFTGNLFDLDEEGGTTTGGGRVLGGILDAVTGNRFDFDRKDDVVESNEEGNGGFLGFINNAIEGVKENVSNVITAVTGQQTPPKPGTNVLVPAGKPQTSEARIKPTEVPIAFLRAISNKRLQTTNRIPPEIASLIQ